jgi:hypothetical protein
LTTSARVQRHCLPIQNALHKLMAKLAALKTS